MSNLRRHRLAAGLTQAELADKAAVSRQLVGAAEAGRNLPRVDAGIALAAALGVGVEDLFSAHTNVVDALTGNLAEDGALLRVSRVGDWVVTAPVETGVGGWDLADAVHHDGNLEMLQKLPPGVVIAGCEPGLLLLERILRETGTAAMSVMASNRAALDALMAKRIHAAVVHGPALRAGVKSMNIVRFRLATWQVGLAAPADLAPGWFAQASSGQMTVVQREPGAGVQSAFEDRAGADVPGPRARGHIEAAQRSVFAGVPAVTIEPAARAVGANFEPLGTHQVEMWVAEEWVGERFVSEAINVVAGKRFMTALNSVGGYDLAACGTRLGI